MANFPASLDTGSSLPNPTTSSNTNNPSHAGLHASENAAIIATETKLGTGSSTPASNTLLIGTGAGTSAWSALTSAQLAAVLSDETGSGSAVFANTPVLITPKIDTINENTGGNGVTVGGVNLKSGVVSTASSVGTTALVAASVTPSKLALGAATASVGTTQTTTSTAFTDLATVGPVVTVTIGANGVAIVILSTTTFINVGTDVTYMGYVASGANTIAASTAKALRFQPPTAAGASIKASYVSFLTGLTPGSTTFTAKYATASANTGTWQDREIAVVPL